MRRTILDLDFSASIPIKLDDAPIENWDGSKKEKETTNSSTVDSEEVKSLKALLSNHKPLTKYPKMVKSASAKSLLNKDYQSPLV